MTSPTELIQGERVSAPEEDQKMNARGMRKRKSLPPCKSRRPGIRTADLCRKHGISDANFYSWRAKYGGLEVSEAKRVITAPIPC
jgi:hypothetical protein